MRISKPTSVWLDARAGLPGMNRLQPVAGDTELVGLQFLVEAESERQVLHAGFRLADHLTPVSPSPSPPPSKRYAQGMKRKWRVGRMTLAVMLVGIAAQIRAEYAIEKVARTAVRIAYHLR